MGQRNNKVGNSYVVELPLFYELSYFDFPFTGSKFCYWAKHGKT